MRGGQNESDLYLPLSRRLHYCPQRPAVVTVRITRWHHSLIQIHQMAPLIDPDSKYPNPNPSRYVVSFLLHTVREIKLYTSDVWCLYCLLCHLLYCMSPINPIAAGPDYIFFIFFLVYLGASSEKKGFGRLHTPTTPPYIYLFFKHVAYTKHKKTQTDKYEWRLDPPPPVSEFVSDFLCFSTWQDP